MTHRTHILRRPCLDSNGDDDGDCYNHDDDENDKLDDSDILT